jgi:hypothetical protein
MGCKEWILRYVIKKNIYIFFMTLVAEGDPAEGGPTEWGDPGKDPGKDPGDY